MTCSSCLNAIAAGYAAAYTSSFDAVWSSFCPGSNSMCSVLSPFPRWTARSGHLCEGTGLDPTRLRQAESICISAKLSTPQAVLSGVTNPTSASIWKGF